MGEASYELFELRKRTSLIRQQGQQRLLVARRGMTMPDIMPFNLSEAIEVIRNTPVVLRALLSGLSRPWIRNNYGPDTFSPFDVVGHLIHGERTDWIPRLQLILVHGETRSFEPFDRYAMYEIDKGKNIGELIAVFEQLRNENVATLESLELSSAQLDQRGMHPELGSVTARELIATWVVHDLNHIHQITKSMAHQYREHVGPWRAHIPFIAQR